MWVIKSCGGEYLHSYEVAVLGHGEGYEYRGIKWVQEQMFACRFKDRNLASAVAMSMPGRVVMLSAPTTSDDADALTAEAERLGMYPCRERAQVPERRDPEDIASDIFDALDLYLDDSRNLKRAAIRQLAQSIREIAALSTGGDS